MSAQRLRNYVGGEWIEAAASTTREVRNPATDELLAEVPMSGPDDVGRAVAAAHEAFSSWRRVPPLERSHYLFELRQLLERHSEELAATVTREHGKTLAESRGSVRRGIECVEVAAGAPSLLMGQALEDVARGIDCQSVRQPVGVFACVAPFNFPAMVPLWFFPFAVACGNTFVIKPSEQVPLSQKLVLDLVHEAGFPAGVINLVNGGRAAVDGLLEHPDVKGVSFVGSSPVAEHVYKTAAAHGKRVQALGGAKNFMVVMPDANMASALDAVAASAYGCAGERCLAASVVLAVGDAHQEVRRGLAQRAVSMAVGNGLDDGVTLGPLISRQHKERVLGYIQQGLDEGAELVVDGRDAEMPERGNFVGACLFDRVLPEMVIAREEIFGPVLCICRVESLERAMQVIHEHPLANASSIFTTSGRSARAFKYEVDASMAAVNIGVAAPMAFFSFGGAKGSFFGDLKAHGREAFDFYTDRKVIMSRWD